jgi:peptidyl-prolyl cis-trans isomerase SurA
LTSIPRGTIARGMRSAHVYSVIGRSAIRPVLAAAGCLVAALAAAPSPALAQVMCVEVNGKVITDYDIEQRTKFNWLANHKSLTREEIIDELIDDELKVQIARRDRIDLQKDVDAQYADIAKRMQLSPKQLTRALNEDGVNATTVKAKIRADISWQYIIRRKFQVDEKSVNTEGQKMGGEADVGYDYTLRPILFIVPSGNAPLLDARRKDADALRTRFTNCEAGLTEARAQHDVIIRPPITRNSSDLSPAVREILNKTEIGHLTPPETTRHGVELFALCDRKKIKFETQYLRDQRRLAMIKFIPGCLLR